MNGYIVHLDGDPKNNAVGNLEYRPRLEARVCTSEEWDAIKANWKAHPEDYDLLLEDLANERAL